MKKLPLVSIITVNYNGKKFLKDCFDSLYKLNYPKSKIEIIMVDNSSTDGSIEFVKKNYPKIKVILNDVNNYCRANNLGIKQAKGVYIALINNDIKTDKDWLIELIEIIESDKKIGAVTSKILFMDSNKIQSAGHQEYPNFYWGDRGFQEEDRGQYNKIEEIPSICGCSVLYRRACLNNIGLFDEDFIMYFEDVDISMKCRKNKWKLLYVPMSIIYHKYLGSAGQDLQDFYVERNRLLFIAKHYPYKLSDSLFGKGYFLTMNKEKFYGVLEKVLTKLLKEHGRKTFHEILPAIIESLKKIENFDKDFLAKKSYQLEAFVKERDNKMHLLEGEIRKRDEQIKSLEINIKELQDIIKQHNKYIKEQSELIDQRAKDLQIKDQKISDLEGELKIKKELLEVSQEKLNSSQERLANIQKELNGIYTSTGFKYLLRPLWTILWNLKVSIKKMKKRLHLIYSLYFFHFKKIIKIIASRIKINKLRNKKLLSINEILYDIRNKERVIKEKPRIIHITITSRCNLKCKQCDIWKTEDKRRELTTPEWKTIIEKLHQWVGEFDLHISGGEPFLRKDLLLEIIRFSAKRGIRTFTTTNGTFITENIVKEFVDAGLFGINISLDSSDPSQFNYIRSANIYDLILRKLSFLCKYRESLCITIAAIIMGYNINGIVELVNLVENKKIANRIVFQPLNQNFSAKFSDDWYKSNEFWPKDIKKMIYLLDRLIKMKKEGAPIDNPDLQFELMKIYFNDPKELVKKWQCNTGENNLNITINGDALLCWSFEPIGNLLKDSPAEIWLSKTAEERRFEITKCKRHCSLLNCNFTDFFYAQYL